MKKPLYQHMAQLLHRGKFQEVCLLTKLYLPSGSGLDQGTFIDSSSSANRLVFGTAFHHMNEHGFYVGWSHHQIIVTPDLGFSFKLRVTGRDVRSIKEHIAAEFNFCLEAEYSDDAIWEATR